MHIAAVAMTLFYTGAHDRRASRDFLFWCLRRFRPDVMDTPAIGTGEYGKPYITSPAALADVRFNLSHCGGLMVCLMSGSFHVGVDCEEIRAISSADRIASRYFTADERQYITDERTFFEVWTRKEAYIKCTGKGLSQGLRSFSVIDADGRPCDTVGGYRLGKIDLQEFAGHAVSYCVTDAPEPLIIERLQ